MKAMNSQLSSDKWRMNKIYNNESCCIEANAMESPPAPQIALSTRSPGRRDSPHQLIIGPKCWIQQLQTIHLRYRTPWPGTISLHARTLQHHVSMMSTRVINQDQTLVMECPQCWDLSIKNIDWDGAYFVMIILVAWQDFNHVDWLVETNARK